MPMVKWFLGLRFPISSKTPLTMADVNSFDESPYRPPMILGNERNGALPLAVASLIAVTTSRYRGSPTLPGSLVRSRTATLLTVAGNAAMKCSTEKGRYRRTLTTPTFSPRVARYSTVSWAASAPEPINTITRSASGGPT
jgi:hypothetical protein